MNLTGKLLIAMPGMADPRFEKSVIFMCAHSPEGAMGLIVNKPADDLKFSDLLKQLEIPRGSGADIRVHFGGPVESGRGFVLHSRDYLSDADGTLDVDDSFGLTATLGILSDMSDGHGPDRALLAFGYSGWGPGQLEDEIAQNGWLTCDAEPSLIFGDDDYGKWAGALKEMGIDPLTLSAAAGRA